MSEQFWIVRDDWSQPGAWSTASNLRPIISPEQIQKSCSLMKVQAFCEEKSLMSLLGIFGYDETKNQWKLKKAFSLSNLHISKMAAKLKNNCDICKRIDI